MDLVTGGTGLLGTHVMLELLDRGRSVRALARPSSDKAIVRRIFNHYREDGDALFERVEWVEGDLLDVGSLEDALQEVERVFHAAALVTFDPRRNKDMVKHNVEGTANMVNAALDASVERFCHVSSTGGIGRRNDGSVSDETTPWERTKHTSPYAVSKYEAELEVFRGIGEGLHAMMVNPCVILGPGPSGRSSMKLMETLAKGTRFYPPGLGAFVDARDVAWAMAELTDKATTGERYLLVADQIPYEEFFKQSSRIMDKKEASFALKPWMLALGWRLEAMRTTLFGGDPMVTKYTARSAQVHFQYDASKVKETVGLEYRSVEDSIRNVVTFLGP